MMDVLRINRLAVEAIIGVYPWEKQQAQTLLFDIEFQVDTRAAAVSDNLADAIDYQAICEQLAARVAAAGYELIEALAADAADWLFATYRCDALSLTVYKPNAVAAAESISLTVCRP